MSRIDLHMHSYYSDDGEFSPQELADFCLESNVKYFAIADHNSVKGVAEAVEYCKDKDVNVIPAVELDCSINDVNLHVIGYNIDYTRPIFNELEEDIVKQEQKAANTRMKLIRGLGIDFLNEDIEKLSRNGVVTGEMIGEAAMKFDKNQENPLLMPYYENGSRSDNPYVNFYWDFCAQGKAAYVNINYISLKEAISIIEEAGGIPVLAHPGNNIKEDVELFKTVINHGIKGIEVYSSYHNDEQTSFYKKLALENDLFMTCGSDFHGKTKPSISVGSIDYEGNEESIITLLS